MGEGPLGWARIRREGQLVRGLMACLAESMQT